MTLDLDTEFASLRLDVGEHTVDGLCRIRLHVHDPARQFPAVLRQQFHQVGPPGIGRHRVHVSVEAEGQGEDSVDCRFLLHVFRRGGDHGQVRYRHVAQGARDRGQEVGKAAGVGAGAVAQDGWDTQLLAQAPEAGTREPRRLRDAQPRDLHRPVPAPHGEHEDVPADELFRYGDAVGVLPAVTKGRAGYEPCNSPYVAALQGIQQRVEGTAQRLEDALGREAHQRFFRRQSDHRFYGSLPLVVVFDGHLKEHRGLLRRLSLLVVDAVGYALEGAEGAHGDESKFVLMRVERVYRHRAVHVAGEEVDAARGKDRLLHYPVPREAVQDLICLPPLDDLLSRLDVRDDAQALRAGGLRLLLPPALPRELDHGEPQERFVAVGQHVHVFRVEHSEVYPHRMRPRKPEEYVLAVLVDDLALVGHGYPHAHRLEREALVVAVHVGEA